MWLPKPATLPPMSAWKPRRMLTAITITTTPSAMPATAMDDRGPEKPPPVRGMNRRAMNRSNPIFFNNVLYEPNESS